MAAVPAEHAREDVVPNEPSQLDGESQPQDDGGLDSAEQLAAVEAAVEAGATHEAVTPPWTEGAPAVFDDDATTLAGAAPLAGEEATPAEQEPHAIAIVSSSDAPLDDAPAQPAETRRGAGQVNADNVTLGAGGAGTIRARTVTINQGGAGLIQAQGVRLEQSGAGVIVARRIESHGSNAVFMIAREVRGSTHVILDWRGIVAAIVTLLVLRGLRRRRAR